MNSSSREFKVGFCWFCSSPSSESPLLTAQCRPPPGLSLHWGPEEEAAKAALWPAAGSSGGGSQRVPGKAEAWLPPSSAQPRPHRTWESVPHTPASGLERLAPLLTSYLILTFTELSPGLILVSAQFGYSGYSVQLSQSLNETGFESAHKL